MSLYKNIFHYYRGQTKNGISKILQIENNTTKAFLNVLQHSSSVLTKNFITLLGLKSSTNDTFEYFYQVSHKLHNVTDQAVVVGIAETSRLVSNADIKQYNIPDGAIISDSISILIEAKIGQKSYLDINQIEGHKRNFAEGQIVESNIYLTWEDIRSFLQEQLVYFKQTNDHVTQFLIEQFEEFCVINCIGGEKTNEFYFLHFEHGKAQEIARQIHHYIWNESGYKDVEDAGTRDGIGYKRRGKPKFATLSIQRQRHFILHLGKKEQELGLTNQKEIDQILGKRFERQLHDDEKYPHEAYIRLEWVDSFEQIKPFIDLAYHSR